jgi:hypothetical protein
LQTPFGTIHTPNITPDRETGIGRWRFADFERVLRWGIAPDDSHYLPVFPFAFYDRLSDQDVVDLKAFLDTVPAVSQVNRVNDGVSPGGSGESGDRDRCRVLPRAIEARRGQRPDFEPWRIFRRGSRPLRRLPHAAQLARCARF